MMIITLSNLYCISSLEVSTLMFNETSPSYETTINTNMMETNNIELTTTTTVTSKLVTTELVTTQEGHVNNSNNSKLYNLYLYLVLYFYIV